MTFPVTIMFGLGIRSFRRAILNFVGVLGLVVVLSLFYLSVCPI